MMIQAALKCRRLLLIAILVNCLIMISNAYAAEPDSQVEAMRKNATDAGKSLTTGKFLVVPIPVQNPTLGTGLTLAGVYMHGKKEGAEDSPTTTSGIGGMYTSNQSWLVGAFHDGYYFDDFMRVRAAAGYGELSLKYYGIGNDSFFRDNPFKYSAQTAAFTPRILFELPWDKFFLGPEYMYVGIENTLHFSAWIKELPDFGFRTDSAGIGLVGVYDGRDNNIWPTKGPWVEFSLMDYGKDYGGDYDYNKITGKYAHYFKLVDPLVLVTRLDGQAISGRAPFWDLAQVNLRGFPFGRYLDENSVTAQGEIRWNIWKKWTLLGFGGGGRIAKDLNGMSSAPTLWAGGGGIRYNIGGEHNLNIGIDVTYADENTEIYFQVGDWLAN